MTIHLPQRRLNHLAAILNDIPHSQKRLSKKKWFKILGELRSMSLAIPGARGLFSQLQSALQLEKKGRIALRKGVHAALDDFRWLQHDLAA